MSMATTILKDISEVREQVLAICNMPEEQLNELQWQAAMECLEKVLQTDEHGISELPKTSAFWRWWKEQWYRRDCQFLNALSFDANLMLHTCALPGSTTRVVMMNDNCLATMYRKYHKMSAQNPLVNNHSMEVSFHYLIKELGNL